MKRKEHHIAIIAPSGRLEDSSLFNAVKFLESKGHNVELGSYVYEKEGPFAGSDEKRIIDLQWALDHPKADIIWMARGGYGLTRILDKVNLNAFKKKPKAIIGYSDITALFLDERFKDFPLIHGTMLQNSGNSELQEVLDLIENQKASYNANSSIDALNIDTKITGGNLSLIVNQLGIIDKNIFQGKTLFLEEIAEYDYKIDRMMIQLERAGVLESVKAVLLGAFSETESGRYPLSKVYNNWVQKINEKGIPCLYNLSSGHLKPNHPIIFNHSVNLNYSEGELTFLYQANSSI